MRRERISQGSEFEQTIGDSRAIVDGRWVFVAGTTGFDSSTMTVVGLQDPRIKIEIEVTALKPAP